MKSRAITLLLFGIAAAGSAQDRQTPPELMRRVAEALPSAAGDPAAVRRLLSPEIPSSRRSEGFRIDALQKAVGETLVPNPGCSQTASGTALAARSSCLYRSRAGSVLRYDLRQGKIDYINPARRFEWESEPNSVPEEQARALALRVAAELALPQSEILTSRVKVRNLNFIVADGESQQPPVSKRAEVHVRVPRQVAGTYVLGSRFHAVVDTRGQVARLHADWPDFALRPGLSEDRVLSREEVARRIATRLAESFTSKDLAEIVIVTAYVEVDDLGRPDLSDREDNTREATRPLFEPALVIHAIPVEPREGSGEVALPILEITQPLLEDPRNAEG